MQLRKLVLAFLDESCAGLAIETHQAYFTKLRQLLRFLGDEAEAESITKDDLIRFKLDLTNRKEKRMGAGLVKGGLSPFTIRTTLVTTRYFFRWSHQNGYIHINPMEGLRIPKEPPVQPKAVEPNVAARMVEAAAFYGQAWERVRNVAMIYCFRDTGCRVGGLVDARVKDVDLTFGSIEVTEKGGATRLIFISDPTILALKTWMAMREELCPYIDNLFINKFGTMLTRGGFYKVFRKLAIKGKVTTRFNPHAFRHAFAKDTIEAGIDLTRLSQLLGHASIDVTNRYYARWNRHELKASHDRFTPVNSLPDYKQLHMEAL